MKRLIPLVALTVCLTVVMMVAGAQQAPTTVNADDVNDIASKLYCPVCENIPLDACGTAACADWRNEIRLQLEAGMSEAQIVTDFVNRFGDRVVGTPQDPLLRALSLITPWLLIGLGLVGGGVFVMRAQRNDPNATSTAPQTNTHYYDQLERDLQG